ncbi:MAG: hypothetical protein IPF57_12840 [Gammaproteobacteria bacterium]|nr:hypothetical protein [Gammaproteobacteria bacterium]
MGLFETSAGAGSRVLADGGVGYTSDDNALTLDDGTVLLFGVPSLQIRDADGAIVADHINWSGWDPTHSLSYYLVGPPVALGNTVYVGLTTGGGGVHLFRSTDGGYTWLSHAAPTTSPVSYRFNLVANPDGGGLWLHQREFFDIEPSLWESLDEGATWYRIDDGSFPAQTVRIVHDPDHPDTSYALTARGLKLGRPDPQGRIHWQATSMWQAVHGLAFVDRIPPLSRALVIGTDTRVLVSVDEGKSWEPMASGLLAIPHTVTWAHGMLVATSEAGYFTCNTVDCAGAAQPVPAEAERGPVTVTEFYHRDLDHYFMTASAEEAAGIDAGAAGPGWGARGRRSRRGACWAIRGGHATVPLLRFRGSGAEQSFLHAVDRRVQPVDGPAGAHAGDGAAVEFRGLCVRGGAAGRRRARAVPGSHGAGIPGVQPRLRAGRGQQSPLRDGSCAAGAAGCTGLGGRRGGFLRVGGMRVRCAGSRIRAMSG